ncbi:DNRLRE domain-containing protein [Pseudenhygromyxa sp. WMMC2535]|uniref:DNRLRE domain-containing protein n=1 Tax=Pseudenhygromyxa sp. WMMC2535 TaxID=2712867 RepID=UPI0020D0F219|nr:DNRLRE domain-containing protein [Pseudenhygromyxa sp. WMMC2535]
MRAVGRDLSILSSLIVVMVFELERRALASSDRRAWPVLVGLVAGGVALGGCVLGENPDFDGPALTSEDSVETGGEADTMQEGLTCMGGTLDCDDMPGCEVSGDDPLNCGSCGRACEVGGTLMACSAGECEGSLEIVLTEDTYAREDQSMSNFGGEPWLFAVNGPSDERTFIDLELASTLPPGAEIVGLELRIVADSAMGPLDLFEVMSPWSEDTLTWASMPAMSYEFSTMPLSQGVNTIDLGQLIPKWNDSSFRGLALLAPSGSEATIHSSEHMSQDGPVAVVELRW